MKVRVVLVVLFLIAGLTGPAFSQVGTGQISGTVHDASGAVVVGANVKVTSERTGTVRNVTSASNGTFVVTQLPAGPYTVEISYSGFRTATTKNVEVTVGADFVMRQTLEPGTVESTVTVSEAAVQVQTSETALSSLVDGKTLTQLPLNRRNPLHFLGLIPGVVGHSAQATSSTGTVTHFINGDRGRGIETQLDGIAIGDPIIPRGELTNAPVTPDVVQEFRVITATASAQFGRSSGAQIQMVTKSGSNEWHGNAYHFLRNTVLDANNFFSNHLADPFTKVAPTAREDLKHNQFGGTIGGPIIKSKAFFFFSYDAQRRTQSLLRSSTTLTQEARNGLFRFVRGTVNGSTSLSASAHVDPATGALLSSVTQCTTATQTNCVDTFNIVAADTRALGLDPSMQALVNLYPLPNDFSGGDGMNTATFRWNAPSQSPIDSYYGKVDYILNSKHELFGRYNLSYRNHLVGDFINGALPRTPNTGTGRQRLSRNQGGAMGWKWLLSNSMVSNATVGFTRTSLSFADPSHPHRTGDPTFSVIPELRTTTFDTPFIYWGGTFRFPEHAQFKEDFSWQRGAHSLFFGGEYRHYRFNNLRNVGSNPGGSGISVFPSVFFTISGSAFTYANQIAAANTCSSGNTTCNAFTTVSNTTDRARLNNMFNELLGVVGSLDQIMYSDGTQYQPGNGLRMYQRQKEFSLYIHDDWRINGRLTLNAGVRYEMFGVPYDKGGLQVVPDHPLDQPGVTFLPAGPGTGRSWYNGDHNNFAQTIGAAFDPWGTGKTVLRASYRVSYNRLVGWALNVVEQRQPAVGFDPQILGAINPGTGFPYRIPELGQHPDVTVVGGLATLNPPNPNVIQFTPANNRRESPFFFDDDFRTAYVHQFTLNVQRELRPNLVVEVGYVGSRGRGLFEFLNVNQIEMNSNGFLQEFINAQNNLRICRATTGCTARFSNQGLAGQVNVPIFTALFTGVSTGSQTHAGFSNSTSLGHLDNNNLGALASAMDRGTTTTTIQNSTGPLAAGLGDSFFRPNPQFDVAGLGSSNGRSWYNSLQMQIKGTFREGLQFAATYTFQKSIDTQSDETVGAGTGFSFPFDSQNPSLSRARSDFDVNQVFRGYVVYDLPFGRGKRWANGVNGVVNHLVGGWQLNSIVDWSSGFPFTVSSNSQTLNYFITSPANCSGGDPQGEGFVNPTDSRGGVWFFNSASRQTSFTVANTAPSQVFTLPAPGTLGTCGRNTFTGPGYIQFDFGVFKSFQITETWKLDFRTEMFNAFNEANFNNPGTLTITSSNFGKITSLRAPNRIIQFAFKLSF